MCLGVPGKVVEVRSDGVARVEFSDGVVVEVDASTIEGIEPGDTVIVHAGIVIAKVDEEEASRITSGLEELIQDLESKAEDFESMLRRLGAIKG